MDLKDKVNFSEISFEFLESKLFITLTLAIQLIMFCLTKLNGDSVEKSDILKNVIFFREVFIKLSPIQEQLQSQIEYFLKFGENKLEKNNLRDSKDPLSLKPSFKNDEIEEEESENETDKIEKRDTKVKIQQSFETPNKNIINKEQIKKQKKLMRNKYFQNLNREINDKPEEIVI